jgi:hypothetical protein
MTTTRGLSRHPFLKWPRNSDQNSQISRRLKFAENEKSKTFKKKKRDDNAAQEEQQDYGVCG